MIYHVFDEREIFSEFAGGAISRWAACVLRHDEDTHVVCVGADESWGFPSERLRCVPSLRHYLKLRARRFYPPWLNGFIVRGLYGDRFPTLRPGDVVWVHGQPAIALAVAPWIRRARAKLVLHLHGSLFATSPAKTMRDVAKVSSKLVFCSAFLEQEARVRFPDLERTAVLYNGADDSLFYPNTENIVEATEDNVVPTILVACRLVPEKGVHVFMDAMRLLQERGVRARARVLGSSFFGGSPPSPYLKSLHRMAPSNVSLAGYYVGVDLAEQFRQAHVFCLPAIYNDPFPLAVIEGMASALPVVATRRGGIPEALIGGGGMLVTHSSPGELAEALKKLVTNGELRRRMGREGYASYKTKFTWKSVYRHYHQILASV